MNEPQVLYESKDNVAVITLNRPEVKNVFSKEMIGLWHGFLERAREDKEVRVIVLTGNGEAFCSGGDIRDMAEGRLRSWAMKNFLWEEVHRIALTMENLDKPVIAAINGAALGAGMDMALMCDMRVCSDRAVLAESYIHLGLVGPAKAIELLLTGDSIEPEEALQLGIVNRVVEHDRLMEETLQLAGKIARKPPLAVHMMKRAVRRARSGGLRLHLDYVSSQLALLSETEDHLEAAKAFLEKRQPVFSGK
jgi:enoyl-CoA hydratase/carnithine racemase